MKNTLQEFKKFAMRGNVIDLAVGIVVGAAFGKIVSSFVSDIIMPPLGIIIGGVHFNDLKITLQKAQGEIGEVTINYGQFIQTVVDFTIIAFAIFMMIKVINKLQRPKEEIPPAPAEPSEEILLLREIRDSLKK